MVWAIFFLMSVFGNDCSHVCADDPSLDSDGFKKCLDGCTGENTRKTPLTALKTAEESCQKLGGKVVQEGEMKFRCQCSDNRTFLDPGSKVNCASAISSGAGDQQPTSSKSKNAGKDSDDDDDEESPFECAAGGGSAAGQATQQAVQQKAQLENQCNQSYEQARVACDQDSVVGVDGLYSEALAKAEKAKTADEKSLKQACEEYRAAFDRAAGELKSFRGSCSSAKSSCLGSCSQAVVQNSSMGPLFASVASCLGPLGAITSALMQSSANIEQLQIKDCTGFETVIKQADEKIESLVVMMREADKCQSAMTESCKANPQASHCRQLDAASALDRSNLQEVGSALESPDLSLGGGGRQGGANLAPVKLEKASVNSPGGGGASANLGGGGGGTGGPTGASGGGGGYYSEYDELYERMKGDQYNRARRGSGGGQFGSSFKRQRRPARVKKRGKAAKGRNLDLKKYLPGGQLDPQFRRDGITSASGPSIFEKVTNRYKVHKRNLMP